MHAQREVHFRIPLGQSRRDIPLLRHDRRRDQPNDARPARILDDPIELPSKLLALKMTMYVNKAHARRFADPPARIQQVQTDTVDRSRAPDVNWYGGVSTTTNGEGEAPAEPGGISGRLTS